MKPVIKFPDDLPDLLNIVGEEITILNIHFTPAGNLTVADAATPEIQKVIDAHLQRRNQSLSCLRWSAFMQRVA